MNTLMRHAECGRLMWYPRDRAWHRIVKKQLPDNYETMVWLCTGRECASRLKSFPTGPISRLIKDTLT